MARYDFGEERRVYVHDMDDKGVEKVVKDLISQAKEVNAAVQAKHSWGWREMRPKEKEDSQKIIIKPIILN